MTQAVTREFSWKAGFPYPRLCARGRDKNECGSKRAHMDDAKLVAASAIALAVTLFSIFSMRPLARRMGLVDRGGRAVPIRTRLDM